MSDPFIRTATAADAEQCLAVLTLAFVGDPPWRWAWPDPQQYWEAFPRFARAFGGEAIDHGTAHYHESCSEIREAKIAEKTAFEMCKGKRASLEINCRMLSGSTGISGCSVKPLKIRSCRGLSLAI
jgi:hypothetical protein